jgi:ribosomal protein L37AE/L43A
MSGSSGGAAPIYHCPFCAEEDLRPVPEPQGAWSCGACARVFTVGLVRVAEEQVPARAAATAGATGGTRTTTREEP